MTTTFSAITDVLINDHNANIDDEQAIFDELETLECDDFYIEVDGMEFRIICVDAIADIHTEYTEDLMKECYDAGNLPDWFINNCIDWEAASDYIVSSDGYGPSFASYDGEEYSTNEYYIFRTN